MQTTEHNRPVNYHTPTVCHCMVSMLSWTPSCMGHISLNCEARVHVLCLLAVCNMHHERRPNKHVPMPPCTNSKDGAIGQSCRWAQCRRTETWGAGQVAMRSEWRATTGCTCLESPMHQAMSTTVLPGYYWGGVSRAAGSSQGVCSQQTTPQESLRLPSSAPARHP